MNFKAVPQVFRESNISLFGAGQALQKVNVEHEPSSLKSAQKENG